ncbi:LOB domain-containing protein 15 [Selaginella moellendorffii]|uniref:LOB domain-containing protein 15 n=1 Tax=Selaginella moellendorffii TaxID=88036 RepID=UPI000D1CBA49|nr:LOB domain-containing protein 15 [Selaginella moellendorffii]|eukprot:XP_002962437.2 LOB domain-containing protein 15 [Selaginella moellendorffii]
MHCTARHSLREEFVKHCSKGEHQLQRIDKGTVIAKRAHVWMSKEWENISNVGGRDPQRQKPRLQELQRYHHHGSTSSQQQDIGRGRSSMLGSQGPLNTITPCAACKLLRRRCAQECPFAPYFSPHEPQKFAAVHKVFGASNVSKMLSEVPEAQRSDVANSLVYEANARIRDPVYGCTGTISALQQQAQSLQAEVNAMREQIMRYQVHENAVAAVTLVTTGLPTRTNPGSSSADYVVGTSGSVDNPDVKERYW